jgi:hypothetical protein
MLHAQDILILLKLSGEIERSPWLQQDVARELAQLPQFAKK